MNTKDFTFPTFEEWWVECTKSKSYGEQLIVLKPTSDTLTERIFRGTL